MKYICKLMWESEKNCINALWQSSLKVFCKIWVTVLVNLLEMENMISQLLYYDMGGFIVPSKYTKFTGWCFHTVRLSLFYVGKNDPNKRQRLVYDRDILRLFFQPLFKPELTNRNKAKFVTFLLRFAENRLRNSKKFANILLVSRRS